MEVYPPSVTRIVGETTDKSGALMHWAVRQALDVVQQSIDPNAPIGESMFQAILEEARRAHRVKKQEAANVGTQVHNFIEAHFKGEERPEPTLPGVVDRAEGAIAWLNGLHPVVEAVERRVYSRKHKFVGTLDKLVRIDGKLTLLDYKTSKGIWPEFRYQTSAYCGALEEEGSEKVMKRCLVRIGEDGAIEPHWFNRTQQVEDYRAFLGALKHFKHLQTIKGEQ